MEIKKDISLILGLVILVVAAYDFFISPIVSLSVLGILSLIVLVILLILIFLEARKKIKEPTIEEPLITELEDASRGRRAVLEIKPESYFEVYKPTKIRVKLKNITKNKGMRIYFSGLDYINPSDIVLWIDPNETQDIFVRVIPVGQGERDMAIEIRPLFDENGVLIPESDADPESFQSFSYDAKERMVGGLTSTQRNLLKNVAKIAALATVAGGVLFAYFPDLVSSSEIITSFIPLFITLQIPLLYLYFYLRNKLPIG